MNWIPGKGLRGVGLDPDAGSRGKLLRDGVQCVWVA